MRAIVNPDVESRNGGRAGAGSVLAVLALVFLFFFGFQYIRQPKHVLRQSVHVAIEQPAVAAAIGQRAVSTVDFGWLTFIARPLYLALRFLHDHGIGNWGWSIVVLTVTFNLLTIWPRMMSMKSSLKMMRAQPKIAALKNRYAHLKLNDPKRAEMNAEMMALYEAEGANMFGGCLPLLLQMPLLFAFLSVLRNAVELHMANWLWLADLSSPDPLHILPLLIMGSMVLTQWITPTPGIKGGQRWLFAILMPAVMGLSLWRYASGLSLYWVTGNIINLLIQFAINRSELGREMHLLADGRRT